MENAKRESSDRTLETDRSLGSRKPEASSQRLSLGHCGGSCKG